MYCEKCEKEGASFRGSAKTWGQDPSDAVNTQDNLPGGYAWLCDDCMTEYEEYVDRMVDRELSGFIVPSQQYLAPRSFDTWER